APSRFLATGGGATSDLWLETIATLFDCEVARPLDASGVPYEVGAAEGAALLAWRGLGVTALLTPAGAREFTPDTRHPGALEDAFQRFLELSRRTWPGGGRRCRRRSSVTRSKQAATVAPPRYRRHRAQLLPRAPTHRVLDLH